MQSRNWIPALPLAVLFALQATAPNAQEAVGKATSVRPQAEGSHAGPLSGGSNVYSKETVRTGDAGQADLKFHDSSNLTVGPKSSVRLDKFVYDPNKSASTVAIQATRGSFRFVTGSQGNGGRPGQDPLWHARRARVIRTESRRLNASECQSEAKPESNDRRAGWQASQPSATHRRHHHQPVVRTKNRNRLMGRQDKP
jgi:Uncharacterized protein conserved in bacteria